jgi:hypothetical protein
MLGALAGDIAGSIYENLRTKRKDVKLFGRLSMFTDDTVLTVAVAEAILSDRDYARAIKSYARRHPLRETLSHCFFGPRDDIAGNDLISMGSGWQRQAESSELAAGLRPRHEPSGSCRLPPPPTDVE